MAHLQQHHKAHSVNIACNTDPTATLRCKAEHVCNLQLKETSVAGMPHPLKVNVQVSCTRDRFSGTADEPAQAVRCMQNVRWLVQFHLLRMLHPTPAAAGGTHPPLTQKPLNVMSLKISRPVGGVSGYTNTRRRRQQQRQHRSGGGGGDGGGGVHSGPGAGHAQHAMWGAADTACQGCDCLTRPLPAWT